MLSDLNVLVYILLAEYITIVHLSVGGFAASVNIHPPLATDTEVNNCYIFCEQVYLSEFGVVLAVSGATSTNWQGRMGRRKASPQTDYFFFV